MNVSQTSERLAVGTIVDGRYEIRERLGSGGFGDVYRASQLLFGRSVREVALKVFHQRHVSAANAAAVFSDAITLLGLMEDDPPPEVARRMVQVYDLGLTNSEPARGYIAMRLVPGRRSLADEIRRYAGKGMPVSTGLWYLRRLLQPLAWLHRQNAPLVHGDLKPDNVLIGPDGDLVLTDFGLAGRMPLGATGGTLSYEAPEVLLRSIGSPSSDIYSLGALWYEMLAGRALFADVGLVAQAEGDEAALQQAHLEARKRGLRPPGDAGADALPWPSDINPDVRQHPQVEALLVRCLAYPASRRFSNAGLLLAELDRYEKDGSASAQALEAAAEVLAEPPAAPAAPRIRGVADAKALLSRGDAGAALALAEDLLAADPLDAPARAVQADALVRLGRTDEARRTMAAALARQPQHAVLLEAFAGVSEACGQAGLAAALRAQARQSRRAGTTSRP